MGLDQYAYARKGAPETETREFEYLDEQGIKQTQTEVHVIYKDEIELAYWRKHPNLQGWMEQLYRSKGGDERDFNCVDVVLTAADLDSNLSCTVTATNASGAQSVTSEAVAVPALALLSSGVLVDSDFDGDFAPEDFASAQDAFETLAAVLGDQ